MSNILREHSGISTVLVIGLGYIGLPTAAIIAACKTKVIGVDINQTIVDTINQGKITIIEPNLDVIVQATVAEGYLRAKTTPEPADVFIIAVATPFKENKQPDLSHIEKACHSIAPVLKKGDLVILESTSPVGATEQVVQWLEQARPDLLFPKTEHKKSDVFVAYCPERVLPGRILDELVNNDRIIGGITEESSQMACSVYKMFVKGECIITDARTAEMCKLAENSYRDVNIAFANELSIICDELKINPWSLIKLANRHPRVNILAPGPGVGGHCIAVDPWFIVSSAPEQAKLISTARQVNDEKPLWVLNKVNETINSFLTQKPAKEIKDVTIACFGITYKADTDDLRQSPALDIAQHLAKSHKGFVLVVDPYINVLPNELKNYAELCSAEKALQEADIALILVNHKEFQNLFTQENMPFKIIDTQGVT